MDRDTVKFSLKFAKHAAPPLLLQLVIPDGVLVTDPEPVTVVVRERGVVVAVNVAVQVLSLAGIVKGAAQSAGAQLSKLDPPAAVPIKVTFAPLA